MIIWLVVWKMNGYHFPHHIGNFIIPTDELHHFSEGMKLNHQPVIYSWDFPKP